ncbi:MAG TPA: ABC transporter ATP-binding protein [Burkholderiales bacterium]|nr:ABC transporter ATP-binding protein [Burkholderiales bacterium]
MLSCENLYLHYPGKLLCQNLSVEITPGKCWGVLGKNGSGKTTMLLALCGLHEPAGGNITLDGHLLQSYTRRQLGQSLGVLLQEEDSWFWGSVLEYVLLGRHPHVASLFGWTRKDEEIARQALQKMELTELAQRPMNSLSGGERQRARLAQLLTQDTAYLLLDEPLQHLDLRHQLQTMNLLRELAGKRRKAVLMVLHDMLWIARYCDQVLLLFDEGRAVSGTTAAVLTRENLETLYQCGLREFGAGRDAHFIPRAD